MKTSYLTQKILTISLYLLAAFGAFFALHAIFMALFSTIESKVFISEIGIAAILSAVSIRAIIAIESK